MKAGCSEKRNKAMEAVRDYLIELLQENNWCEADRVGNILKELVEHHHTLPPEGLIFHPLPLSGPRW